MKKWYGSAAVCINEDKEVLMVRSINSETWAIPSGGIEEGETPEECCIREVKEETGYDIVIEDNLFIKETETKGYKVKTYYFKGKKTGESEEINDADNIIVEAGWKSLRDIQKLQHAYPEDLKVLESFLK